MSKLFYQEDRRPVDEESTLSLRRLWARYLVTALILGLAIYLLFPELPTLENALSVATQMSRGLVLFAVFVQVGSYIGSGYLMQAVVLLAKQRISLSRGIVITLAANSINLLAGGTVISFALTYRWMRNSGANREGAGFACTLPWVFNNLVLVLMAIAGLLHLFFIHKLTTVEALSFLLIGLILSLSVLGVAWGIQYRDRLTQLAHWVSQQWASLRRKPYDSTSIDSVLEQLFHAWRLLCQGGWRGPLVGAALNNGLDAMMLYILFIAMGHPLGFGTLLTGYGLPLLLGKLGILPGGLGIVEASMAVIYGSLGVPNAVFVVVILVYRLMAFWVPTVLGFLLVLYLQHSSRTVHGEK